jgi:hypothetical protein
LRRAQQGQQENKVETRIDEHAFSLSSQKSPCTRAHTSTKRESTYIRRDYAGLRYECHNLGTALEASDQLEIGPSAWFDVAYSEK